MCAWITDLNLETSTCTRILIADGSPMETVRLRWSQLLITDEGLDRFVKRFPIQQWATPGRPNTYR